MHLAELNVGGIHVRPRGDTSCTASPLGFAVATHTSALTTCSGLARMSGHPAAVGERLAGFWRGGDVQPRLRRVPARLRFGCRCTRLQGWVPPVPLPKPKPKPKPMLAGRTSSLRQQVNAKDSDVKQASCHGVLTSQRLASELAIVSWCKKKGSPESGLPTQELAA